jgi:PiT family inorganic phosphate transporter
VLTPALILVTVIVVLALIFDFINGFHDAANSIATVVSTRVLSPKWAVVWAAFFNFIAAFFFGTMVAKTIGSGMMKIEQVTQWVILSALLGAVIWNLITWWLGLPTSSSHALIGAYGGAAVARAGLDVIILKGWTKTIIYIFLSPLIGLAVALGLMVAVSWIFRRQTPGRVDKWFRRLQFASAAAFSFAHGTNDAQKTMGIIAGALYKGGFLNSFYIPFPVVLLAHAAIALGTLTGGWRIVKTMGQRITKLKPVGGFCAETAGALTIIGVTLFGIPVSTTHTITGAIVGVGTTQRMSAVRWGVATQIIWAWVLTIPAAGFMAWLTFHIIRFFLPTA